MTDQFAHVLMVLLMLIAAIKIMFFVSNVMQLVDKKLQLTKLQIDEILERKGLQ